MSIVAHDADILVISSDPESHGWAAFLHTPTLTYYGFCGDIDCCGPWSLNLVTRELVQCGCRNFTPEEPHLPEVTAVLLKADTEAAPQWRRWLELVCPEVIGCGDGRFMLDAISREATPCHRCGWTLDTPCRWADTV